MTEDTYLGNGADPLSLNLYAYCANNPIRYVDPTGHAYDPLPTSGPGMTQQQSNINSAYNAMIGGYISYDAYAANVRQNGGTPVADPRAGSNSGGGSSSGGGTGGGGGSNSSSSSSQAQSNIKSAYNAWQGGYISYNEYAANVSLNGGTPYGVQTTVSTPSGIQTVMVEHTWYWTAKGRKMAG